MALPPEDIADIVFWPATVLAGINVNAIEIMPVTQAFRPLPLHRKTSAS